MNISNRWLLLLAAAAVGATIASKSRRHLHRSAHASEHKIQLKSWENEGGNLAPIPVPEALP